MGGHDGTTRTSSASGSSSVVATCSRVIVTVATVLAGCAGQGLPVCPCLPGVNSIVRSKGYAYASRGLHSRVIDTPRSDFIEFDPCDTPYPRIDIDANAWAHMTGLHPVSHRDIMNNGWKMDPNRDLSHLSNMGIGSLSPTPEHIAEKECIALRNARELAEQLGYVDFVGDWPQHGGIMYCPKGNHLDPDVALHIEDTPTTGQPRLSVPGETSMVISRPVLMDRGPLVEPHGLLADTPILAQFRRVSQKPMRLKLVTGLFDTELRKTNVLSVPVQIR